VESYCELGNEPSGSIKCWELPSGCTSCGLSGGTQLHRVSQLVNPITSTERKCALRQAGQARFDLLQIRFEVFTAVTMKTGVFWDVTPCGSCKNRRFGGTYSLHHQGASAASNC
jgi:hypothetical protein